MESHVSDTWQSMCHNAWQRYACVTHGMPCVIMHGPFESYKSGVQIQFVESSTSVRGSSKEKEEEGKREREERRREREERKGEREEKKRKGKKKREEKRKGRVGKERGKGGSVAQ